MNMTEEQLQKEREDIEAAKKAAADEISSHIGRALKALSKQ